MVQWETTVGSTEMIFHLKDSNILETTEVVYDYSKLPVAEFIQYIEDRCPNTFEGLDKGNLHDLNTEVTDLYSLIKEGLHLLCPTKVVDKRTHGDHTKSWFDQDCKKHRNKLTKIKSWIRKSNAIPIPKDKEPRFTLADKKEAYKNYRKAQKKARKKDWDKSMAAKISNRDLGKLQK